MSTPPSPLAIDPHRQQKLFDQLQARFEQREALRLTPQGLKSWLDAAVDPLPPERVAPSVRDEVARLRHFGLLTDGGSVPAEVRPAVDAVREPLCTIDIEAAVGRAACHFRAWVGAQCAVLFYTDSPWSVVEPTAEAVARYDQSPGSARELRIVPRDQPILAAARWALVTPRRVVAPEVLEIPAGVFTRRLVDHTVSPPARSPDLLSKIWTQPLFSWGFTISPTQESVMVLDAATCGHRQVIAVGDHVQLHALPSLALWDGMVRMLANALDP